MLKTHMAACLVATMFAAPAFAQAPTSPATPAPGATSPVTQAPAGGTAMPSTAPMSGQFMTKIESSQIMASELIGTKVIGANNESIGDINDVVMDRNGKALAAIVGVGGFLGIGEKDVAVPFDTLEFATREQVSAMQRTDSGVTATGSTTATGTTATTNNAVNAPAGAARTAATSDGEPERVILRMTKAQLQDAPKFDTDRDRAAVNTGTTGAMPASPTAPATTAPKSN